LLAIVAVLPLPSEPVQAVGPPSSPELIGPASSGAAGSRTPGCCLRGPGLERVRGPGPALQRRRRPMS